VRLVVPDTSFVLSAFLSPGGQRRKLLIVLAYGYFSYYARVGTDEIDAVRQEAEHSEVTLGGRDIEELVGRAAERRAELEEFLPLAPDDLTIAGSRVLFDEVEEKVASVGPRMLKERFEEDDPARVRRGLEAITAYVVPDFPRGEVPRHTEGRDRDDDYLIEIAFQAGAEAVLSDDRKHIALTAEEPTVYEDPRTGAKVGAYQQALFVERFVNSLRFDVNEVDPALLELALRP
jgi:predicted nucleic acid-binding protein